MALANAILFSVLFFPFYYGGAYTFYLVKLAIWKVKNRSRWTIDKSRAVW